MNPLREFVRQVLIERSAVRDADFCRYERAVIRSLQMAGLAGRIKRANCTDSAAHDADMVIDGELFYLEVKADDLARMGSASLGYSMDDKAFHPTGLNKEFSALMADIVNGMQDKALMRGISRLVRFMREHSAANRGVTRGFPMSGFTPTAWSRAKQLGMISSINRNFMGDVSVIFDHYAQKDVYYIQIGGRGLYYLSANPANLPIPQLSGKVRLELTASKSGDIEGRPTSKAALRVHARINPSASSPYTLDDPESVKALLASVQSGGADVQSADAADEASLGSGLPAQSHVRGTRA